jgi:hypothetical protein
MFSYLLQLITMLLEQFRSFVSLQLGRQTVGINSRPRKLILQD